MRAIHQNSTHPPPPFFSHRVAMSVCLYVCMSVPCEEDISFHCRGLHCTPCVTPWGSLGVMCHVSHGDTPLSTEWRLPTSLWRQFGGNLALNHVDSLIANLNPIGLLKSKQSHWALVKVRRYQPNPKSTLHHSVPRQFVYKYWTSSRAQQSCLPTTRKRNFPTGTPPWEYPA